LVIEIESIIRIIYREDLISGLCGKYGEKRNERGVVVGKQETDDGLVNIGVNGKNLKGIR
jgi:hypothetical protein